MNVRLLSLSGEHLDTIRVLSSDSISDLKEQLHQSKGWASVGELQLLQNSTVLDDTAYLQDLVSCGDTDLQVIWSRRSAREMLFDSPEGAVELAQHYDALQDQCKEHIASLFLDKNGNDLDCVAKMEVLVALHQKLRKANDDANLAWLKTALAEVALAVFREYHELSLNPYTKPKFFNSFALLCCFPWFGLAPVQTLLLETDGTHHTWMHCMLAHIYAKHPVTTLQELLGHLQNPATELAKILHEAISTRRATYKKSAQCRKRPPRSSKVSVEDNEHKSSTATLECPKEVLAYVRHGTHGLSAVGTAMVDLGCKDSVARYATCEVVLEAIKLDPVTMLRRVDVQLALAAVKYPGTYSHLPEDMKSDQGVLYTALVHDPALQEEFMSTASKSEIKKWQWHTNARSSRKTHR